MTEKDIIKIEYVGDGWWIYMPRRLLWDENQIGKAKNRFFAFEHPPAKRERDVTTIRKAFGKPRRDKWSDLSAFARRAARRAMVRLSHEMKDGRIPSSAIEVPLSWLRG